MKGKQWHAHSVESVVGGHNSGYRDPTTTHKECWLSCRGHPPLPWSNQKMADATEQEISNFTLTWVRRSRVRIQQLAKIFPLNMCRVKRTFCTCVIIVQLFYVLDFISFLSSAVSDGDVSCFEYKRALCRALFREL